MSGSGSIANPFKDAPAFRLRNDQGKAVALEDFRGKVIVLHFWATWCPPCIDELPQWVEFARKFENQPVAWVAVSLDRSWDDAHRYLKPEKLPANVVSLLDPENQIPEKFGSYQFPETYLIGPDLKILSKWVGAQDWESPTKEEVIQRVVDLTQARK